MTLNEDPNTSSTASGGSTTSGGGGVASSVTNVAGALSALSSASGSMYVSIYVLHSNSSCRRRLRRVEFVEFVSLAFPLLLFISPIIFGIPTDGFNSSIFHRSRGQSRKLVQA